MRCVRCWLLAATLILLLAAPALSTELLYRPRGTSKRTDTPVATTDGRPLIRSSEMDASMAIYYYNAARDLHRRQLAWIRSAAEQRLVEGEANKRSLTVDKLLEQEAPPGPVTEAIIAQFLSERGRPNDKITPKEREFLEQERKVVARRSYIDKLWEQAKVQINLPEPERPQVIVSEGNTSPVLGLDDAPVTIIEFCAFTSPHCRDAWTTLREMVKRYGYQIRIVHRDYPLAREPTSLTAAIAARCAHRQKKFWAYHDTLYDNQDRLDEASLKEHAKSVGLDTARFNECLDKRETAQEVEWDAWEGRRVQLPGLPSLFVNFTYVAGALPLEEMNKLIQGETGRLQR